MSSLVKTKTRLTSTKSTQKVIKAMELVASSKIKKAREKAQAIDFYYDTTMDAMKSLYQYPEVKNYLHNSKAQDKTLVISITSDMGLCGPYNANVLKAVTKLNKELTVENVVIGSKGIGKLEYENLAIEHSISNYNSLSELDIANEIVDIIVSKYENLEINDVKIVYTKFVNPIVQEVEMIDLFNIEQKLSNREYRHQLLIEPDEETVFKQVIRQYFLSMVYTAILHSFASEHSYRRNSMETANKNSLELIESLDLELNRIRQAMITQEITEILGGSEALKK